MRLIFLLPIQGLALEDVGDDVLELHRDNCPHAPACGDSVVLGTHRFDVARREWVIDPKETACRITLVAQFTSAERLRQLKLYGWRQVT